MSVDVHIPKIPDSVRAFLLLSLPLLSFWLFNAMYRSPPIHSHAFALFPFSLLFMPFFGFITIHFATAPPNSFSSTLAPLAHPSFRCLGLSQTSSDSQTKTFAPMNHSSFPNPQPSLHPNRKWDIRKKSLFEAIHWSPKKITAVWSHLCPSWQCIWWGQRYSSQRQHENNGQNTWADRWRPL